MNPVGFQLHHTPVAPVSRHTACVFWSEEQNRSFNSNPSIHRLQNPQNSNLVSSFFANAENTSTNVSKIPRVEASFLWVGVECYIISEKKNERRRGRLEEHAQFGGFPGTTSPVFLTDTRYISLSFLTQ